MPLILLLVTLAAGRVASGTGASSGLLGLAGLTLPDVLPAAPEELSAGQAGRLAVSGERKVWHTVTVDFEGPPADELDSAPNPFLDYRLQVTFRGPVGQAYDVPGFFDGDGAGGGAGRVWRVRFTPDAPGTWTYQATFRSGPAVALEIDPSAGAPAALDQPAGSFVVTPRDPGAPGFRKWGRLEYAGGHYLKFRDGPHWIKGGTDSPENLLGYRGFDNTPAGRLSFLPHVQDWQPESPRLNPTGPDGGAGLIGALDYLSAQGVNSIYFLPLNVGGDGRDTAPYAGPVDWNGSPANDNLHFDVSKLAQWEVVFAHAQHRGILLHVVLNEAESANKRELDDGTLGRERRLFYRELIARFGHHLALQWNVCEEYDGGGGYDLGPERVKEFAAYIQALDPYDHPITVHNAEHPDRTWSPFVGDGRFSVTSFQLYQSTDIVGPEIEKWRRRTAEAGRPLVISVDEPPTVTRANVAAMRREVLWPAYLSGGQLEWFVATEDQSLEDFRAYEALWAYTRHARRFLEEHLPFWEMEPLDRLLSGLPADSPGQVFAKPGEVYAVYLPRPHPGAALDLSGTGGPFTQRWYNPRSGRFEGQARSFAGGGVEGLGPPPGEPEDDWAVLVERAGPASLSPDG